MTLDDLKRLFSRQTLFRLDAILAPKLVPILYALGLAGILLWAISHLFWTFGFGFGNGLWGLLEIAVFGLLLFVGLRIGCEALLVWFKTHEGQTEPVTRSRYSSSLLDEVRDAIRDLAEAGEEREFVETDEYVLNAVDAVTEPDLEPEDTLRSPATRAGEVFKPRRTAKRTPRIDSEE
ncbi:DUF4282 domain-containing protein [Devosia sp. 1566]|uniref:DUF4282 domain-containing protein n=1 Tax=Devosia sp. 1566 TaxID=2499144 RepID=UPI000FD74A50|nr:DUF4282 domain-containing protein [Devosia sp. 1566]